MSDRSWHLSDEEEAAILMDLALPSQSAVAARSAANTGGSQICEPGGASNTLAAASCNYGGFIYLERRLVHTISRLAAGAMLSLDPVTPSHLLDVPNQKTVIDAEQEWLRALIARCDDADPYVPTFPLEPRMQVRERVFPPPWPTYGFELPELAFLFED